MVASVGAGYVGKLAPKAKISLSTRGSGGSYDLQKRDFPAGIQYISARSIDLSEHVDDPRSCNHNGIARFVTQYLLAAISVGSLDMDTVIASCWS